MLEQQRPDLYPDGLWCDAYGRRHPAFVRTAQLDPSGADVVCSDIKAEGLRPTVEAVEGLGRRALVVRCDVTDEEQVRGMVETAVRELGRLDILITNAGIADRNPAPVHENPTDDRRRVDAVNLDGVYYCAREALKVMVRQGSGKVINIASIWAWRSHPACSRTRRTARRRAPSST